MSSGSGGRSSGWNGNALGSARTDRCARVFSSMYGCKTRVFFSICFACIHMWSQYTAGDFAWSHLADTALILEQNPEHYSVHNYRRQIVQRRIDE